MIVFYSVFIFRMYDWYDSNMWKASVCVLGQAAKMVGNNIQLKLINLIHPHSWVADGMMFDELV